MLGILSDPFKLFGRGLVACFKIAGYTITFIMQILWFISHGRTDKIGDAFGGFGRSVTDAIGDIFQ